jgi:hypothetical protein
MYIKSIDEVNEGMKSNIKKKWNKTDTMMDDLREFILDAKDAGGEDLVRDIHDALRLMTNYAAGELKESVNEGSEFKMVSAKFKDALDDASEISVESVEKLIKKFREKRPDAAMAYAKQAFGWMMKEGKLTEAAPKMKNSPFVENIQSVHKEILSIDNQMKLQDKNGWDRCKGEFKKALVAIGNLTSAIRRHGKNY